MSKIICLIIGHKKEFLDTLIKGGLYRCFGMWCPRCKKVFIKKEVIERPELLKAVAICQKIIHK